MISFDNVSGPEAGASVLGEWEKPGTISPDEVAIVGEGGFLFLLNGSNRYYEAYDQCAYDADYQSKSWISYASTLSDYCEKIGSKFLLTIVPNKATILNGYYPLPLRYGITPRLKNIVGENAAHIHVPIDLMKGNFADKWFRRNDTHFTYFGNINYVNSILEKLDIDASLEINNNLHEIEHIGDLGSKFLDQMREHVRFPIEDISLGEKINIVDDIGMHTGVTYENYNADAMTEKSVIMFGNSFSERIPSWGMSPYLARIFKRYFFHWGGEVDMDLVENLRPDYVILQTCERFLSSIPKTIRPSLVDIKQWPDLSL